MKIIYRYNNDVYLFLIKPLKNKNKKTFFKTFSQKSFVSWLSSNKKLTFSGPHRLFLTTEKSSFSAFCRWLFCLKKVKTICKKVLKNKKRLKTFFGKVFENVLKKVFVFTFQRFYQKQIYINDETTNVFQKVLKTFSLLFENYQKTFLVKLFEKGFVFTFWSFYQKRICIIDQTLNFFQNVLEILFW